MAKARQEGLDIVIKDAAAQIRRIYNRASSTAGQDLERQIALLRSRYVYPLTSYMNLQPANFHSEPEGVDHSETAIS